MTNIEIELITAPINSFFVKLLNMNISPFENLCSINI